MQAVFIVTSAISLRSGKGEIDDGTAKMCGLQCINKNFPITY